MHTAPAAALIAALLALPGLGPESPRITEVDPFGQSTPVLLVMDTSGSMDELDDLDQRRIDIARSAMLGLVKDLGETTYGMISYPGGPVDASSGCTRGEVRTRLAPLDVTEASSDIRHLSPDGDTPTGPALLHAQEVLQHAGYDRGVIVIVSDGESNCGPPPCEVAQGIVDSDFDLRVYPVGFHVGSGADELRCVAQVTGGTYVDATDTASLQDAIGAAVPAHLTLTPHPPSALTIRTGTYSDTSGQSQIKVDVRSDGRLPAHDVRVSLSLTTQTGRPLIVSRPIRHLGNLAAGQTSTLTFDVRAETVDVAATWQMVASAKNSSAATADGTIDIEEGLDLATAGPLLRGLDRVVVMGDSYSAGEGSHVYAADSPGDCHRSGRSYGGWLLEDKAIQLACSGAVTSDFFSSQTSGEKSIPPQLEQLRDVALADTDPVDAVFLTIGGNDAGFAPIAHGCIMRHQCNSWTVPLVGGEKSDDKHRRARAEDIQDDVYDAVAATDKAANDAEARAKRGGAVIPIIVLPYVRIIPEVGAGADGCQLGLSSTELDGLNGYLDQINRSVKAATDRLRSQGRPVYYVSYVVDAFQPNHTICEGLDASFANMDNWQAWEREDPYLNDQQVLHPTSRGYGAIARAIVAWSRTDEATPVTVNGEVVWDPSVIRGDPVEASPRLCGILICLPEQKGEVAVAGTGFLPGSRVVARIASTPRTVASFRADSTGSVLGVARVPATVVSGDHEVILLGSSPNGAPMLTGQPVRIWPRATTAWMWAAGLGVILLAYAGVTTALASRRQRRRDASERLPGRG